MARWANELQQNFIYSCNVASLSECNCIGIFLTGLPYLLMKKVYTDAFILHDESEDNFKESQQYADEEEEKNRKPSEEPANSVRYLCVIAFRCDVRLTY